MKKQKNEKGKNNSFYLKLFVTFLFGEVVDKEFSSKTKLGG